MSRGLSEEESSVPSRKNIPVRGRTSTQAPRWEQGTAVVRGRRGRQCAVIRWARRRLVRGAAEMVTWALSAGKAVCVGFEMRARKPLEAFRQGTSTAGRHLERSLWGAAGQGEKQGGPCSNPGQRGGGWASNPRGGGETAAHSGLPRGWSWVERAGLRLPRAQTRRVGKGGLEDGSQRLRAVPPLLEGGSSFCFVLCGPR